VVGLHEITRHVRPGDMMILDGYTGTVILNPLPDVVDNYRRERDIRGSRTARFGTAARPNGPNHRWPSHRVGGQHRFARRDQKPLLANGAEGVGLYRTEFVYLNRNGGLPTEEDHYRFYAKVAQSVLPHPVIIAPGHRRGQVGGPGVSGTEQERTQPVLGVAGIRLALRHPICFARRSARSCGRRPTAKCGHVSHGVGPGRVSRRPQTGERVHGRTAQENLLSTKKLKWA
jgi:phosphotransferase system enzyme I (PtsI)